MYMIKALPIGLILSHIDVCFKACQGDKIIHVVISVNLTKKYKGY